MNTPTNRVNSYERKKGIDSNDVDIVGAVETTSIADTAAGKSTRSQEIDTSPVFASAELEFESFMNDVLEVFVGEAQNENEPQFVEVNVGGDYRCVLRGETANLKRYHVAVLAQAKVSRVVQRKVVNADGSMGFVEENKLSLAYPFQVQHDPNLKRGSPWLKQILANPV